MKEIGLNKILKETEELMSKIIFKRKYLGQHQSSTKILKFHGNKWVTALPPFPYFRNLSDYNLKWESVTKTTIYRERKATLLIVTGFFSNAAWFAISITWTKQNRTFSI